MKNLQKKKEFAIPNYYMNIAQWNWKYNETILRGFLDILVKNIFCSQSPASALIKL